MPAGHETPAEAAARRRASARATLRAAREKRGWSFRIAAQHMDGVSDQQLRNLEGEGANRETDPMRIRLGTALELVRVYWPDVQLEDLVGEPTLLRLVPRDAVAQRRLRRYAAGNFARGVA